MQRPITWILVTTVAAVATYQGLSQIADGDTSSGEVAAAPQDDSSPADPVEPEGPAPGAERPTPPVLDWADAAPDAKIDPITGLPRVVIDKQYGFRMILVNAGTFERGLHASELNSANAQTFRIHEKMELPSHEVTISQAYYLGEREITQGEWFAVAGAYPAHHDAGDEYPIESITRKSVLEFLSTTGYRLPTESEWEYACRAGEVPLIYTSPTPEMDLTKVAWFQDNSGDQSRKVAHREPNTWGFYDMLGNVSEFCSDIYDRGLYLEAKEHGALDPQGAERGKSWVIRGSHYASELRACRPSFRFESAGRSGRHTGFRLARTP